MKKATVTSSDGTLSMSIEQNGPALVCEVAMPFTEYEEANTLPIVWAIGENLKRPNDFKLFVCANHKDNARAMAEIARAKGYTVRWVSGREPELTVGQLIDGLEDLVSTLAANTRNKRLPAIQVAIEESTDLLESVEGMARRLKREDHV